MKQKLTLVLAMFLFASGAFAQINDDSPKKKPDLIGIHFNAVDFITPVQWKNKSTTPQYTVGLGDMDFGLSVSYWKGLTTKIDLSVKGSMIFANYAGMRNEATVKTELGLELEPTLNFRPINDNALIAPFLTGGIGIGMYTGEFGVYAPAGVGIQVNFNSVTYLMLQAQYRFSLTQDVVKDNLFYSLGFAYRFKPAAPKVVPPPPPPVIGDQDKDGILDNVDKCPTVPGVAKYDGCPIPDTDKDGINDEMDKCPTVPGLAKYNGCPIPDTDGDGINDEEDKCVTVPGVAKYFGCPVPDTDGDGLNDEVDKCPNVAGPKDNYGCPIIGIKAFEIAFKTGSAVLLGRAKPILDTVVAYMNLHKGVDVYIDGYTDNTGSDKVNDPLSVKRAEATKAYIVSKGIDAQRMTTAGYGSKNPVADNKTAAGRTKNRRIEIRIHE